MRTMSNEEIIKVVQASMDGAKIECDYLGDGRWGDCGINPLWSFTDTKYRVKQLTLEEFIEEIKADYDDSQFDRGFDNACGKILDHMKKLQGEDND